MRERLSLIALAVLSASALLAGCAAGPDYRAPAVAAEPAFVMPAASAEPAAAFWRGFGDPVLDTLLVDAVTANADVRLAQARLREAHVGVGDHGIGEQCIEHRIAEAAPERRGRFGAGRGHHEGGLDRRGRCAVVRPGGAAGEQCRGTQHGQRNQGQAFTHGRLRAAGPPPWHAPRQRAAAR